MLLLSKSSIEARRVAGRDKGQLFLSSLFLFAIEFGGVQLTSCFPVYHSITTTTTSITTDEVLRSESTIPYISFSYVSSIVIIIRCSAKERGRPTVSVLPALCFQVLLCTTLNGVLELIK